MEFLYDIPVIGLVIQFIVYLIVQRRSWRRRSWPRCRSCLAPCAGS